MTSHIILIDKRSGISSITVSDLSRLIALLSIIPILLVVLGLMVWWCLQCRRRRTIEHLNLSPPRWKPTSLKHPTLMIYFGLILTLIMLLEAAQLALPERGVSETTIWTRDTSDVAVVVETLVTKADFHLGTVAPTQVQMSSVSSAELPTTEGDRTRNTEGFMTEETGPSPTEQPPQSSEQHLISEYHPTSQPSKFAGWQSLSEFDPTPTNEQPASAAPKSTGLIPEPTSSSVGAPAPGTGWLLNDDAELSSQMMYFIGTFLPVLMASVFAIPWKILDLEVQSLEPFAQLARPSGRTAPHNLLLNYNGFSGFLAAFTAPFNGHSAVALSTFLRYSSAMLIPLATGSIGLTLQGKCLQDWKKHCSARLEAVNPTIRAAQGLLAVMACAVIMYLILSRGRTFGVVSDPRSMLGIASLSLNPYLSTVLRRITLGPDGTFSVARAAAVFENRAFQFGYITYATGEQEYGITIANNITERNAQICASPRLAPGVAASNRSTVSGILIKVVSLATFIMGVLILILYYSLTYLDTEFERFMSSQKKFGPRFLFAFFGVIVGFGWASVFYELATVLPAWDMSRRPVKPERSILMPLNPNPYVGAIIYPARRHLLLAVVSIVTILSDFLPIAFANVPFNNAITWKTHRLSVWISVGVLGFMLTVLTLITGILLRKAPRHHIPFKPTDFTTPAAVLYLACRSEDYLTQLQTLSVAREADIKKWIKALDSSYSIISIVGEDGNLHYVIRVS